MYVEVNSIMAITSTLINVSNVIFIYIYTTVE